MVADFRWLILLALNGMMIFLASAVNNALSPYGLTLYLIGPTLILPAVLLGFRAGFACTALTGLLLDAATPVPFGTTMSLCLITFTGLHYLRSRLKRAGLPAWAVAGQVVNALLFIATCYVASSAFGSAFGWLRAAVDLLFSQAALLLVAFWFLSFEKMVLRLAGHELEKESRA